MTSRSDRRDANEVLIASVVAAVCGWFFLTVLEAASMYEPVTVDPPRPAALGICPDCHQPRRVQPEREQSGVSVGATELAMNKARNRDQECSYMRLDEHSPNPPSPARGMLPNILDRFPDPSATLETSK